MIDVPTPLLVVLAVAAFLLLATFSLWGGVIVLAVACLALGLYGMAAAGK